MTFKELVRQSTGSHFLDSGGSNGRHWQRPLPPDEPYFEVSKWTSNDGTERHEVLAYIPTHSFLDAHLEIDEELTSLLRGIEETEETSFSCMSAAERLSKELSIPIAMNGDNTYNHENDLTQDFQYAVLSKKCEWYYDDNALILLETHNGADIRGGYSDVVVCKQITEAGLLDTVCGARPLKGTDKDGKDLSDSDLERLSDHWQIGYSSNPIYQLNKDIESIITDEGKHDEITVRLKTGEVVTIYIDARLDY